MNARNVVITGVGGGIGKAMAELFAQRGDRVWGSVRNPDRADVALGDEGTLLPLELSDAASIEAFVNALPDRIDVLVHNAGFGVMGSVEEIALDDARRQFEVNFFGPLRLTQLLLPRLRTAKSKVFFVGSLAGRIALPFQAHYSATKSAIASISDALRMECRPFGVAFCCVEPGDFATGFTDARKASVGEGSPYKAAFEACAQAVDKQEREGADPSWVAKKVVALSHRSYLPARLPVGRFANTITMLKRLMPNAWAEPMIRSAYQQ